MVKIPEKHDPTIEAMFAAIEAAQSDEKRDYLGCSAIGDPCPRKLWYEYQKYDKPDFDAQTLMRFEDGHRTEDLTADRLRMIKELQLWTHDDDGNQYGFTDFDGRLRGHCDGVILGLKQAPNKLHVWECKSCDYKKFNEFCNVKARFGEKATLKNWNQQYFVQAQLYMHYLEIDRHYTTVALGGGRAYNTCRTEYEPEVALYYRERARKIIEASEPPPRISDKPDYYICKWCPFADICHDKQNDKEWRPF